MHFVSCIKVFNSILLVVRFESSAKNISIKWRMDVIPDSNEWNYMIMEENLA